MKTKNNDKMAVPHHIDDDDLVSYLDGELVREMQEVRTHLERCWDCRRRLSSFERSIENFLQVRQDKLLPPELPPSGPALEVFRQRLAQHRTSIGAHSYFKLKIPNLRAFFRNITGKLKFEQSASGTPRLMMRVMTALLLASIIGGLVFLSNRYAAVSASELLERARTAQTKQISATTLPVIHQRLQVKHRNTKSSSEIAVDWEIWNDTVNSRLKQVAFAQDKNEPALGGNDAASTNNFSSKSSSIPTTLIELEKVLQNNHMDPRRPLSAASYQSWSESVKSKTEEVVRLNHADGFKVLTLKTVPTAPVANGGVIRAEFTVRESDWHPTKLYLRIKADEGENEYELTENEFEVVSLTKLNPAMFFEESNSEVARLPTTTVKATPSAVPSASPEITSARLSETAAPTKPATKMPIATNEAEVEALDSLHKIGADITEQLNITRTADGRLMIEGIVETDKRKNEILHALMPVTNNPAIKINIQTIDEAARSLALVRQKQKLGSGDLGNVSKVEVNKGLLPDDAELRSYFSKSGGNTDDQIRKFASSMINHSQSALFQASAMNRLANRFTVEQLRTLEPSARAKWLSIIKGYASAVRRETVTLRQELEPVFFSGMPTGGAENVAAVGNDADLIQSARNLYEMASANDRIVRSAFTLSSGNVSVSAVKTPQFRRALASAEKLAAALEKSR